MVTRGTSVGISGPVCVVDTLQQLPGCLQDGIWPECRFVVLVTSEDGGETWSKEFRDQTVVKPVRPLDSEAVEKTR